MRRWRLSLRGTGKARVKPASGHSGGGGEAGDGSTAGVGGAVLPPGSMRGQRLPSSTELQGDSLVGGGSQTLHANRMHLE